MPAFGLDAIELFLVFVWLAFFFMNLHDERLDILERIDWFLDLHLMAALLFTNLTDLPECCWLELGALFTSFFFVKFQVNRIVMVFFVRILWFYQI